MMPPDFGTFLGLKPSRVVADGEHTPLDQQKAGLCWCTGINPTILIILRTQFWQKAGNIHGFWLVKSCEIIFCGRANKFSARYLNVR